MVNELTVSCNNKEHGCSAEMLYEKLALHLQTCDYEQITCSGYEKCKFKGNRLNFVLHANVCKYVPMTCTYCQTSVLREQSKQHETTCE